MSNKRLNPRNFIAVTFSFYKVFTLYRSLGRFAETVELGEYTKALCPNYCTEKRRSSRRTSLLLTVPTSSRVSSALTMVFPSAMVIDTPCSLAFATAWLADFATFSITNSSSLAAQNVASFYCSRKKLRKILIARFDAIPREVCYIL